MRSLERHRDVAAYALGVLNEAEAFRFEDHLMECPRCAAHVTEFGPAPDLELAEAAWRWLQETELLAPDLNAVPGGGAPVGEDEGPKVWTPAWQLGLPLGHLAIHLF